MIDYDDFDPYESDPQSRRRPRPEPPQAGDLGVRRLDGQEEEDLSAQVESTVALTNHLAQLHFTAGTKGEELAREAERFNATLPRPLAPDELAALMQRAQGWGTHYTRSDTGNAERWLDQYRADLLYTKDEGQWYQWDGQRWRRDVGGLGCLRQIKGTLANAIFFELTVAENAAGRRQLAQHLVASLNTSRLKAARENACSEPGVAVERSTLDAVQYLVGVRNGVLDLRTGEHRAGRREDRITLQMASDYIPGAEAPSFMRFLQQQVSPEVAAYLQQLVGLTLLGNTLRLLIFIYGPTATGKSVLLEVVKALFGEYGRAISSDALMARAMKSRSGPTEAMARLAGARLVTVNETSSTDAFDEALIKDLTGGDTITARELYKGSFEFTPNFVIWVRGNHKPRFSGNDAAMLERIRLVPFSTQVPEQDRDDGLRARIIEHELPGVLNWALAGAAAVRAAGRIVTPPEVAAATREYGREMDTLGLFLEECAKVAEGSQCSNSAAYEAFKKWCAEQGIHPWTLPAFSRAMGERFKSRREKIGGKDTKQFLGVEVLF